MLACFNLYQMNACMDNGEIDEKSREEFILEYAPLVKNIAERMVMRFPPNISADELINSGVIGLIDAIDKFDPEKGVKFRTYAQIRIKGAILDDLRKMDWVSRSVRRDIQRIGAAL